MDKDITNTNDKGEFHGYQEVYSNNELISRCNMKNGNFIGYQEWHIANQTYYHIK